LDGVPVDHALELGNVDAARGAVERAVCAELINVALDDLVAGDRLMGRGVIVVSSSVDLLPAGVDVLDLFGAGNGGVVFRQLGRLDVVGPARRGVLHRGGRGGRGD